MNAKQRYIERIRSESSYASFRSLISAFVSTLKALGGLLIFVGLVVGINAINTSSTSVGAVGIFLIIGSVAIGALIFKIGDVFKEACLMVADMADSITDLNSRYEQQ
jgi:hypothetical protein